MRVIWHLLALSLIYFYAVQNSIKQRDETIIEVGEKVPYMELTTTNGKVIEVGSNKNQTYVINFFSTSCAACLECLPYFESEIFDIYSNDSTVIFCVGRGENETTLKEFKNKHEYRIPMVADPDRKIYNQFADKFIPRNVIIGSDLKVLFHSIGCSLELLKSMKVIMDEKIYKMKTDSKVD